MKFERKSSPLSPRFFWVMIIALIAGLAIAIYVNMKTLHPGKKLPADSTALQQVKAVPVMRFGLPVDSFRIVSATIQRNEFFSTILNRYGLTPVQILAIRQQTDSIFNPRQIRAGDSYQLFFSSDTTQHIPLYFVYQPNPIHYVVLNLQHPEQSYAGDFPVTSKIQTVSGVIQSSLYETLDDQHASPALAQMMAEIYAWTIDFFSIQPGDWFKVVYRENFVEGQSIGPARILSAEFYHGGEKFFAFYYPQDSTGKGNYYDENGKSLRKAFLKAPLKYFRITSRYSLNRFHPIQHVWKAHLGTDYAAPEGTPILATGDGVVIASTYSRFNGNYVKIRHNAEYTTQYLHMSRRAVRVGQYVHQGQVIGYVGHTGLATGPHVCYRFWKNGVEVDPLKQHFPAANPVPASEKQEFSSWVEKQLAVLNQISLPGADSVTVTAAASHSVPQG
ncbi:peptidoglycan DD-metalloendopeptidase family protein [Thermoflavifilum thermophilum]|uniref:Murein DD-endopeptidase MepM and murein hydrolase activator NlpD, contain LysM domain n=1 Tax=Thermoflavifilum thermophilum TaxID=1393122 RepID=A0A1I7NB69_9BACT|nr:peptidoglycan DD-metalloendopeptidase family protein [Thermoflavifilum thermophilum]SFV31922.1 Murein DD-endopeptidase MepM and murein hydrolase activator NlpD, contain LysM domain [Thermoflavifilum thermophilum]